MTSASPQTPLRPPGAKTLNEALLPLLISRNRKLSQIQVSHRSTHSNIFCEMSKINQPSLHLKKRILSRKGRALVCCIDRKKRTSEYFILLLVEICNRCRLNVKLLVEI